MGGGGGGEGGKKPLNARSCFGLCLLLFPCIMYARLFICAVSDEPSLLADEINTKTAVVRYVFLGVASTFSVGEHRRL